jgi:hypothetical protein
MSLRGDMIKRARRRVDARREARNRANIRDQYRASYGRNLGKRKFAPTEQRVGKAGDVVLNTIREAGGDFKKLGTNVKDAIFPVFQAAMKGIGSLGDNWERSKQNREILGDVYTDDLRKSMMSDSDREFYEKYMRLGDMQSGQEAQYYYDEANKALQNAQITNRINYALGQPGFGFETTAPTAQAAFNETPEQLKERIDYSKLVDRMRFGIDNFSTGLEGTAAGKAFLDEAYKQVNEDDGKSMMGNKMKAYVPPKNTFDFLTKGAYQYPEDAGTQDVSEQNLLPTYDYNVYGDPMDNILSGEPGSGTGSFLLQSMYPGYRDFADTDEAQKYGLEDMDQFGLMEFGYKNPTLAAMFGFNPNYEFE